MTWQSLAEYSRLTESSARAPPASVTPCRSADGGASGGDAGYGGFLYASNADITLASLVLQDFHATGSGGLAVTEGGSLQLVDATVMDTSAIEVGGIDVNAGPSCAGDGLRSLAERGPGP